MVHKHIKVYNDYFGYSKGCFIPCELTGLKKQDIHHIENKGMGGSDELDYIENLIGLTRKAHNFYGDVEEWMDFLREVHESFMEIRTPWATLHPTDNRLLALYGKSHEFNWDKLDY
jgi:hypothetical protein